MAAHNEAQVQKPASPSAKGVLLFKLGATPVTPASPPPNIGSQNVEDRDRTKQRVMTAPEATRGGNDGLDDKIPCFIDGCSGSDAYVSELMRRLGTYHGLYVCGRCYRRFDTDAQYREHTMTGPECEANCVSSTCTWTGQDGHSARAGREHPKTACCPFGMSTKDRWQYLYHLKYPERETPDLVLAKGPSHPHGFARTRKRRPAVSGLLDYPASQPVEETVDVQSNCSSTRFSLPPSEWSADSGYESLVFSNDDHKIDMSHIEPLGTVRERMGLTAGPALESALFDLMDRSKHFNFQTEAPLLKSSQDKLSAHVTTKLREAEVLNRRVEEQLRAQVLQSCRRLDEYESRLRAVHKDVTTTNQRLDAIQRTMDNSISAGQRKGFGNDPDISRAKFEHARLKLETNAALNSLRAKEKEAANFVGHLQDMIEFAQNAEKAAEKRTNVELARSEDLRHEVTSLKAEVRALQVSLQQMECMPVSVQQAATEGRDSMIDGGTALRGTDPFDVRETFHSRSSDYKSSSSAEPMDDTAVEGFQRLGNQLSQMLARLAEIDQATQDSDDNDNAHDEQSETDSITSGVNCFDLIARDSTRSGATTYLPYASPSETENSPSTRKPASEATSQSSDSKGTPKAASPNSTKRPRAMGGAADTPDEDRPDEDGSRKRRRTLEPEDVNPLADPGFLQIPCFVDGCLGKYSYMSELIRNLPNAHGFQVCPRCYCPVEAASQHGEFTETSVGCEHNCISSACGKAGAYTSVASWRHTRTENCPSKVAKEDHWRFFHFLKYPDREVPDFAYVEGPSHGHGTRLRQTKKQVVGPVTIAELRQAFERMQRENQTLMQQYEALARKAESESKRAESEAKRAKTLEHIIAGLMSTGMWVPPYLLAMISEEAPGAIQLSQMRPFTTSTVPDRPDPTVPLTPPRSDRNGKQPDSCVPPIQPSMFNDSVEAPHSYHAPDFFAVDLQTADVVPDLSSQDLFCGFSNMDNLPGPSTS